MERKNEQVKENDKQQDTDSILHNKTCNSLCLYQISTVWV